MVHLQCVGISVAEWDYSIVTLHGLNHSFDAKRQGVLFVAVGCILIVVDWGVFVVLSWLRVPTDWANVFGRVAGALLGFAINGGVTFQRVGRARYSFRRFMRFVIVWSALTALSTLLVVRVAAGLGMEAAWLAKPIVEATLAVISFFAYRHWVYL